MRYTFDVYGLYNGLFVMDDRQTGSVWTHYDGSVLTGPLASGGHQLEILPIVHTSWVDWQEKHPSTLVLDWYPEYADRYRSIDPGRGGLGPQFQRTILNWDDRLAENELVLGVEAGGEFRAYPLETLASSNNPVQESLGGIDIVVLADPADNYALAFTATLNDALLLFQPSGDLWVDQFGTVWDQTGEAISGQSEGSQLDFVTSFVSEWYGWAAYHPETSIFGQ